MITELVNMKIVYSYSHLGGEEILHQRFPNIETEIDEIISKVRLPQKTKVSEEKTMKGRLLYDPKLFKQTFQERIQRKRLE